MVFGKPGVSYQVFGYGGQGVLSVGNYPGIPIREALFIGIDCLDSFQVKSGMVVKINGGKASNFQAPFGLIGTTGPIPANPGCFLAGFAYITRIKSNGISTTSVS